VLGMHKNHTMRLLWTGLLLGVLGVIPSLTAQSLNSAARLAYIGTLDKKLLIYDENKEEVVGEIPLQGIPRQTALTRDQSKLVIVTTQMAVETVDLKARKMINHFELADERSHPRMSRGGGGLVLDPTGRYLYTTLRVSVKEPDFYRMDPPQFVKIDLQSGKIVQSFHFPPNMDMGFGPGVTYKVSPDGKSLYVFDEDVLIYDLATFKEVDRIEMSRPEYPGASPYRLTAENDPNAVDNVFTSLFTAVDPIVHKGTLGLATLDLNSRKSTFVPIGIELPSLGFMVSPDQTRGYSIMFDGVGGNRRTEFWVWDLASHRVIKKAPFEARPTLRFGLSGDGKKIYLYGAGSSFEVFDGDTLKSRKLIFLNKDTTTNLVTLAAK
jgi:hypothetical protein